MMKTRKDRRLPMLIFLMTICLAACSPSVKAVPPATGLFGESAPPLQRGQIRQWAVDAEASSEFADPEWAAVQAIGAPDTHRCGDYQTAWATASSDTIETLVLSYDVSVYVTGVNIVQSFNPNQIVLVELVDIFDRATPVFESQPVQVDQPCPYTLTIPIDKTEKQFSKVRLTVNQSVLGLGWNQIDAVELIGDMD